ncbi:MAG: DNA-methyltransferase [Candidatus Thorarchaeota archaeon]|jgi:site-specific DNA-methyltransferase (adenine-specific)
MRQQFEVHCGNALDVLNDLDKQVHTVVTSPPYYKKRTYGDSPSEIGDQSNKKLEVDAYIQDLVDVFNAVDLHPAGSVWVNIGEKRNGCLHMVPERFAMEMVKSGWYLAEDIVWAKIVDFDDGTTEGGCMTEPAKYRCNSNGWEHLYRFTKCKNPRKAYSDMYSIYIPREGVEDVRYLPPELMQTHTSICGRAPHNVWRVMMGQTRKKHYAVYPTTLIERPIAATCPMRVQNGVPIERIVEWIEYEEERGSKRVFGKYTTLGEYDGEKSKKTTGRVDSGRGYIPRRPETLGWGVDGVCFDLDKDYDAGVVLDPFCGTGTTGEVAQKLGRSFVGIDLYDEFAKMTRNRCQETSDYLEDKKLDPWKLHK